MALKRREEIEASEGRDILRMAKRSGSSLLYTAAICGAVVVALFISLRLNHQFDVSRQGANTLSEQSLAVVGGLQQDVMLYALYRKEPADRPLFSVRLSGRYRNRRPRTSSSPSWIPVTIS